MKIKIIYDSTIVMSPEEAKENNIAITPFIITDNGESFRDNVDLTPEEFYARMKENSKITTSQPNISETIELFKETLKEYDHIIYFPLPEALSGTYATGVMAANEVDKDRITVVDIKTGAGAGNYLVSVGNQMIKEGKSVEEIVEYFKKAKDHSRFFIMPLSMERLRAGGRVSNIAASVFTMIRLKISLYLSDTGSVDKFEIARTDANIIKAVIKKVKKDIGQDDMLIYLIYTDDIKLVEKHKKTLEQEFPGAEFKYMCFCPTLGAHTGNNTYGFHFVKKHW